MLPQILFQTVSGYSSLVSLSSIFSSVWKLNFCERFDSAGVLFRPRDEWRISQAMQNKYETPDWAKRQPHQTHAPFVNVKWPDERAFITWLALNCWPSSQEQSRYNTSGMIWFTFSFFHFSHYTLVCSWLVTISFSLHFPSSSTESSRKIWKWKHSMKIPCFTSKWTTLYCDSHLISCL